MDKNYDDRLSTVLQEISLLWANYPNMDGYGASEMRWPFLLLDNGYLNIPLANVAEYFNEHVSEGDYQIGWSNGLIFPKDQSYFWVLPTF